MRIQLSMPITGFDGPIEKNLTWRLGKRSLLSYYSLWTTVRVGSCWLKKGCWKGLQNELNETQFVATQNLCSIGCKTNRIGKSFYGNFFNNWQWFIKQHLEWLLWQRYLIHEMKRTNALYWNTQMSFISLIENKILFH